MSTRERQSVYEKETVCPVEGERVSIRGRQKVYQWVTEGSYQRETEDVLQRETECLQKGDRVSTAGRKSV